MQQLALTPKPIQPVAYNVQFNTRLRSIKRWKYFWNLLLKSDFHFWNFQSDFGFKVSNVANYFYVRAEKRSCLPRSFSVRAVTDLSRDTSITTPPLWWLATEVLRFASVRVPARQPMELPVWRSWFSQVSCYKHFLQATPIIYSKIIMHQLIKRLKKIWISNFPNDPRTKD